MKNKIITLVLTFCVVLSSVSSINAQSFLVTEKQEIYEAKVAFLEDVNDYGTNYSNKEKDGKKSIVAEAKMAIQLNQDNDVTINMGLNDEKLIITGVAQGRSENNEVIFFQGKVSDSRYEVVNFAFESNVSNSNVYFNSFNNSEKISESNVLKVYLKDLESKTRDYILIEAFNINLEFDEKFMSTLSEDTMLGAWVAREFSPVEIVSSEDKTMPTPKAATSKKYWQESQTYYGMGEQQTHVIRWYTLIDYANVPTSSQQTESFKIKIHDKYCVYSVSTNLNSSSQSSLHMDNLVVAIGAISNTGWKSTTIDGSVTKKTPYAGAISIGIGVNLGPIGASYDLANLTYDATGSVDLNSTFSSYENDSSSNEFTKNVELELDDDYFLSKENDWYEVTAVLRDYGNVNVSSESMLSRFSYTIVNYGTMTSTNKYNNHNVSVSIN